MLRRIRMSERVREIDLEIIREKKRVKNFNLGYDLFVIGFIGLFAVIILMSVADKLGLPRIPAIAVMCFLFGITVGYRIGRG
jgi:hypothetical protein